MKSGFYDGSVTHVRTSDVDHEFTVSLFMVFVDLDRLPQLLDDIVGWSASGPAIAQFRRSDHFGPKDRSLSDSARDRVQDKLGFRPGGPVGLLTHFRYFGYLFNPVSFYYCYDTDQNLKAVLAEVHNTPWHEEHVYTLPADSNSKDKGNWSVTVDKDFHVSPFQPMDQRYEISFSEPNETLSVSVDSYRKAKRELSASLNLNRKPFNRNNAYSMLLRYPLMSFNVTARIYYEAVKLWWKDATFYPHPEGASS
jgi:DUF1365 family protein